MPLTRWQPPALRHDVDDDGRVTWLELFFDLIYVAALIQLGDRLSSDVSWSGGAAFVGAFVVLWWTWTGTTAFTNRFAVDDVPHRLLTFAQMFAVGNLAVLAAVTPDDWRMWFPLTYVAARIPLLIMYWRARQRMPVSRPIVDFYLVVFGAGSAIWLASLLLPEEARPWAWAIGLIVEFLGPVFGGMRGEGSPLHDEHFQERYALFTVIVLGETFVKTLSEVSDTGFAWERQLYGMLSFVILVALWWTYFDDIADSHLRRTGILGMAPGRNRLVWVYVHLPLAGGITAYGVAAKKIVGEDALDATFKDTYTWLLAIALAVVLLSVAVLDVVTDSPHFAVGTQSRTVPRVVAAALIVLLAPFIANGSIGAFPGIGLVALIVVVQIAFEVVLAQKNEKRIDAAVASHVESSIGTCEHLDHASGLDVPDHIGCSECERLGVPWVQLRQCLSCGHIACCDDSPGHHATLHYERTGHPVMVSLEPGAQWAYCFAHDVTDPTWQAPAHEPADT
ncbi:MAG: low temperature requirement protein A [Actinomycetota bacterium]